MGHGGPPIADGKDPSLTKVPEVLTEEVEGVEADADVTDAADLMASRQIRRLPVVEDGQVVGIVSLGDIAIKHEESTAACAIEGVSEGVKTSGGDGSGGSDEPSMRALERAGVHPKKAGKARRKTAKKGSITQSPSNRLWYRR